LKTLLFKLAFIYPRVYALSCYYRKRERRIEIERKFDFFLGQRWPSERRRETVRHIFELRGSRKVMRYVIPLMDARFIERFVEAEGLPFLDRELKKGRGVVLLASHFGNPHISFNALRVMGYQLVLIKGGRPREPDPRGLRYRDLIDDTIFVYDPSLSKAYGDRILDTLRSGRIIHYYGDTREGRTKIDVSFLGREMAFPSGVFHLARRAHAAVIPVIHFYEGGRIRLMIEEPIEEDWEQGEEGYRRIAERYARLVETHFVAHPEQYMGVYGPTVISDYYRLHAEPKHVDRHLE